ncbi:MAG: bifunctional phosphoribosylaminoimidazolecarboxamide formyltransferase/IMP cyclohydrolase, partial [Burkholderiales bacterium]|nr:bifunctional phosphoribosylaminoimidazolecarboxamide formyltransferase/IMP cyclohydrolase [Burkholderiales bacterium]
MIKRALISVSDKTGVLDFAVELQKLGVEIISTGGTYKYLSDNGLSVEEVANITKFPEILDGRVKTLHPIIHGGILGKRDNESHKKQMIEHGIIGIDLVCVNLYPFEETINKDNVQLDYAVENIDIGGPAMIRAAAKNYNHVVILTSSRDYMYIVGELKSTGVIQADTRIKLAQKAFSHTSYYDGIIANYFNKQAVSNLTKFNEKLTIPASLVQTLRYGENSHQEAAFYKDSGDINGLLASFKQLQGKELSYNNLVDSDAAWECVRQFSATACVIVKHANPCGVALSVTTLDAYKKA